MSKKFRCVTETDITVEADNMYVEIKFEEDKFEGELSNLNTLIYEQKLYLLSPRDARTLAAYLVEAAAECTQSVPDEEEPN